MNMSEQMIDKAQLIEKARDFWQSEMDRIGPDWDTAEIIADFALEHTTEWRAEVERLTEQVSKADGMANEINILVQENRELEGKLAAAERLVRRSRAAFGVLSDTLEPRKGGNLAREQIAAIDEVDEK